jgi:flagella basal body P-ring formation protein FlgA
VPKTITNYRVISSKITKAFSNQNIDIKTDTQYVQFKKYVKYDKNRILQHIKSIYQEKYPFLDIEKISIEPTSYLDLDGFSIDEIVINDNIIKKNRNTFHIFFKNDKKRKRAFFRYKIDATIKVVVSNKNILKDETINNSNTKLKKITFKNLYNTPITTKNIGKLSAKKYIPANKIIFDTLAQRTPEVTKRGIVMARYIDNGLSVEFETTALDTGFINQTVRVKDNNGKIYRAKILGKGLVEIQ